MFMLSCEIFTDILLWQIRSNDAKHGEMYQNACSLAHSVDVNHQNHKFVDINSIAVMLMMKRIRLKDTIGLTLQIPFLDHLLSEFGSR